MSKEDISTYLNTIGGICHSAMETLGSFEARLNAMEEKMKESEKAQWNLLRNSNNAQRAVEDRLKLTEAQVEEQKKTVESLKNEIRKKDTIITEKKRKSKELKERNLVFQEERDSAQRALKKLRETVPRLESETKYKLAKQKAELDIRFHKKETALREAGVKAMASGKLAMRDKLKSMQTELGDEMFSSLINFTTKTFSGLEDFFNFKELLKKDSPSAQHMDMNGEGAWDNFYDNVRKSATEIET